MLAALFDCVTLADVYGKDVAQQVPDIQWIEDAAKNNCAVFTVNHRILAVDHEREAIERHGTKVFCLGGNQGNGSRESRAFLFGRYILSIRRRIHKPGACFWRLYSGDRAISYDIS